MTWRDRTPWAPVHGLVVEHQLEQDRRTWTCTVCGGIWQASRPRGHSRHCPRVPLYLFHIPEGLTTPGRARREGLEIDPEPVACLQTKAAACSGRYPLHRLRQEPQLGLFGGPSTKKE